MSYQDLVRDFNKDYNVNLDVHPIIKRITTIFNTYEGDRIREEDIKNYILESYSALAKDFQINKSKAALAASQNTSNLNAGNFLDRYIDIVTEIASFVSDDLEELAKKEANFAKRATQIARKNAKKAEEKAKLAEEKNAPDAKEKRAEAEKAKKDAQKTADKESDVYTFKKYTPTMSNFGMSGKDAEDLLKAQVNSFTNREARQFEMKHFGVKHKMFVQDFSNLEEATYAEASDAGKKRLQKIHMTRDLMQARLDRHNKLWKWVFFRETRAMREYVKNANETLSKAKLSIEDETVVKAMADQGYEYDGEIKAGSDIIKEKFAENDKKFAIIEEENAKKMERINDIYKKPLNDQFFEMGYRPPFAIKEWDKHRAAMVKLGKEFFDKKSKNNVYPDGIREVFMANYDNLLSIKNFVRNQSAYNPRVRQEQMEKYYNDFDKKEEELIAKHKDYKAMTFDEFTAAVKKEPFKVELNEQSSTLEVSPKIEDNIIQKEPMAKDNI